MALRELKVEMRARGLRATSVNSAGFFLWSDRSGRRGRQKSTPAHRSCGRTRRRHARSDRRRLARYGRGGSRTSVEARKRVEHEIPALLDRAAKAGVRVGIEPMHPLRIFTKACLNTLAQTGILLDRHPGSASYSTCSIRGWDPDLHDILARRADRITSSRFAA